MSAARDPGRFVAIEPRPVDVEAIERELGRLWQETQEEPDRPRVTRACMSNLIVFTSREQAVRVEPELASVVQRHPARALLLVADGGDQGSDIEAYVSAQCHVIDDLGQVCSEHVTVNAGAGALLRLPSVARPLLIGDLPTALWWGTSEAPPLAGDLFRALAEMADQVIYDSFDWLDAVRGVIATATWANSGATDQVVADIAWRRLTPWRRLISESLDPAVAPESLDHITDVVVEHGPHGLPQAWLLIGWLGTCLRWQPARGEVAPDVEVTWWFRSEHSPVRVTVRRLAEGEPEVRSLSILSKTGAGAQTATFSEVAPQRLGVSATGSATPRQVLTVPLESRAVLIARQLPALEHDPLFEKSLAMSRAMAEMLRT
jgi:glucose-6-phosphate dehydrogenase assembly protein OpcA